jgi:hypothetical protein
MAKFIHPEDRGTIEKVYEFGLILSLAGAMPPNMLDYFERPWKWEPEYFKWVDAGKPYPPEAGGSPHAAGDDDSAWESFVGGLDE